MGRKITRSKKGIKDLDGPVTTEYIATVTVTETKTLTIKYYCAEGHYGYYTVERLAQGAALTAKPNEWVIEGAEASVSIEENDLSVAEEEEEDSNVGVA